MIAPPAILMKLPLLRRLAPSILRRYASLFKHQYSIERRMGALFLLDRKNMVDRNLLIKGAWEPEQVAILEARVRELRSEGEKAIFLDIGAHGALYSILMQRTGLFERVVAFEPDPTNLAQLRANLFLNGLLKEIEVIERAASDRRTKIPFFIASEENRGNSRMTELTAETQRERIEVEAIPIDEAIAVSNGFVVAKIDVEGGEMKVLSGMLRIIATNRCLFQIESFEQQFPALNAWLGERGFKHIATCDLDHFFFKP